MVSEILINVFILATIVFALFAGILITLWRRKSRTDRENYKNITGDSSVETAYTLEEYQQLRRERDDKE